MERSSRLGGDRAMYAGLAACGLYVLVEAHRFGIGRAAGAALMPMLVGSVALACGLAGVMTARPSSASEPLPVRGLAVVIVAALVYGWIFPLLGYLASTIALAAVLTFVFVPSRRAAASAFAVEVLLVVVLQLVFTRLFFIPLPRGSLFP